MTISEKVAYLKGLAEGLAVDTEKSKEGKLISVMIDILEEVGLSIEDLEATTDELSDALDAVSDDLSDVEDDLYGEDDDCDCCDCDDDEEFFQVECPNCGETLDIDEEVLDAGVIQCPACKQKFALDLYDEDECGCDCGCDHDDEIIAEVEEAPAPKKSTKKTAKK